MNSHRQSKVILTVVFSLIVMLTSSLFATTFYVATNAGSTYTTIQSAVDVATTPGDLIIVSNGVYDTGSAITPGYALTNRVCITNQITVRSVNGPESTIIVGAEDPGGGSGPGALRCVWLNSGIMEGFTLSNGHTGNSGMGDIVDKAGAGCSMRSGAILSNCTVIANGDTEYDTIGGGVHMSSACIVRESRIVDNSCSVYGAGVRLEANCQVLNSVISGNSASYINAIGGGVYLNGTSALVSNCFISGNSAAEGGGVCADSESSIEWCTITSNSVTRTGGGVLVEASWSDMVSIQNCTISDNSASGYGGGEKGGGMYLLAESDMDARIVVENCNVRGNYAGEIGGGIYAKAAPGMMMMGSGHIIVRNCTVADNLATNNGGGVYFDAYDSEATISNQNTIVYLNTSVTTANSNWYNTGSGVRYKYCCTAPINGIVGTGNIDSNPSFVDASANDYHLLSASPCANSGDNSLAPSGQDLDGVARILGGTVDRGCYEQLRDSSMPVVTVVTTNAAPDNGTNVWSILGVAYGNSTNVYIWGEKSADHFVTVQDQYGGWITNDLDQALAGTTWSNQQTTLYHEDIDGSTYYYNFRSSSNDTAYVQLGSTVLKVTVVPEPGAFIICFGYLPIALSFRRYFRSA